MDKEFKSGLILQEPQPQDYVLGVFSTIFNKSLCLDWSKYLPDFERQGFVYGDPWACVSFSACNCLEIEFNYLLDKNWLRSEDIKWLNDKGYIVNGKLNFNDRFIAVVSGTKPGVGNSGIAVALAIKDFGLIPESVWKFDYTSRDPKNDMNAYYSNPPQTALDLGLEFKKRFSIQFEWVNIADKDNVLSFSPLQVFVNAWFKNAQGEYFNPNSGINHAVCYFQHNKILDSYEPFIKTLTDDYKYSNWAMKYKVCYEKSEAKPTLKNPNIAKADPSKLANKQFIDALFFEKSSRHATAKEIEVFTKMTVKDASNKILGPKLSPFYAIN